jgi:hypothetical protein
LTAPLKCTRWKPGCLFRRKKPRRMVSP